MLDWSKIDNDKIFQSLVNHIISQDCHASGILPSSPYIGADGGYDAYLENYPEENLSGPVCVQAKYTKHSLKTACEYLQAEIPKELRKAEKNKVAHLLIATNAELQIKHTCQLIALCKSETVSLQVWDREKLRLKIEKDPFLRSYFFNSPAIPLFLPASIYFENVKNDLTELGSLLFKEIKTLENKMQELNLFLKDGEKKLFILHAAGGFGKSHFLKELPAQVRNITPNREVWFVRGLQDVWQAFNNEIGAREGFLKKGQYLLVLDDADREDNVKDFLSAVTKSGLDIKAVIALRSVGMPILEDALLFSRCKNLATITSISSWANNELITLLRAVAQSKKIKDEEIIVRHYPNPFFIVKIGLRIKGENKYDLESFKQAILQSLLSDTKKILVGEKTQPKELLLHLALIAPLNLRDQQTKDKLARKLGIDERQLDAILLRLLESGQLRAIGNILRFVPDMIGDVFLLEEMRSLGKDLAGEIFLYWLDTHAENIFRNLGATIMYGEHAFLKPIVAAVISGWIRNISKYVGYEKNAILKNLEDVCQIVPSKATDLLWIFLEHPDLSTDAYGPVVVRLIRSDCDRNEIVKIVEHLRLKVTMGTFSNYKPDSLISETVTPLRNDIRNDIMPVLEIIAASLKDGGTPLSKYAEEALTEILAGTHGYTNSTYSGMEIGSKPLRAIPSVLAMRQKALSIVKSMLRDMRSSVRLSGIHIASDIGKGNLGPALLEIPLKDTISKERQEIADFFSSENLIAEESEWDVLIAYEDMIFKWWAQQLVPDEKTLPLIDQFGNDPEHRILRFFTSRWDLSLDVREQIKAAPSEGRWNWVVENIMQKKWHSSDEDFEKEASYLKGKYPTPDEVISFLCQLMKKIGTFSGHGLFLRAWIKQAPEVFKGIRENKALWEKLPQIFKPIVTFSLVEQYPDMAQFVIDQALFGSAVCLDEASIALDVLSYELPAIDKYIVIKAVAGKRHLALNAILLKKLCFIGNKLDPKKMGELVCEMLNSPNFGLDAGFSDSVGILLHGKGPEYVRGFLDVTRTALSSLLLNRPSLSYYDLELASLILGDVRNVMEFVEMRLEKEKVINRHSHYEAVPFEGVTFLGKVMHGTDDYLYALEKTMEWDEKYEGMTHYSADKVFEQIVALRDGSGKLYVEVIKNRFYDKAQFPRFLSCASQLPLDRANKDFFNEAILKSVEFGFEENMEKLLKSKISPEGGWTSSAGEIPPAFIEKKEVFIDLRKNAPPGRLRSALDECVLAVESMIENHKKDEENHFYSRS